LVLLEKSIANWEVGTRGWLGIVEVCVNGKAFVTLNLEESTHLQKFLLFGVLHWAVFQFIKFGFFVFFFVIFFFQSVDTPSVVIFR
jgi:hypothetical protein